MRTWTFTLRLDTESRTPLYRQVARGIAQAIREGRLKTGDPLPGQRTLAEQLEVNRQTIAEAYRELALEGWISTRHGGGTFVERPPAQEAPPLPSLPSGPGFPIPTRTLAPTLPRRSPAPDLFQAGTGVPDLRLLPMAALSQAYHRALRAGGSLSLREGDPQGHPRLRESLAAMLASTRSIASTQASLQITSGGQLAFYLLARTLLQDGDAVAVEAVGRKEIWSSFQEAGAKLIPLPVDAHGVDIDALEQAATRTRLRLVYLTPQRQYPTTAVLSPERRGRLMDLARRHHLAILEHDDEAELHFEGPPTLPLAAQDPHRCVIHVGTLSKLFAPGMRLAFIHGPQALIQALSEHRQVVDHHGDQVLELAMADLIREGELNRHLLRLRRACLERRDCIVESLGKALGDRVSFASPTGGMALWLRPARGHPDLWCEGALSRRVLLGSATKFTFPGQPVQAGLRLGYAAHDPVALREIACRLAEVATEISV